MLHLCAIIQKFMKNKYIRSDISMIVSSISTENRYIFDWFVSVIVRICLCRSIVVSERDKISSQTAVIRIGVRLVHGDSTRRWFRDWLWFSNYPLLQDVPDLTVFVIPQICLFITTAHYGPCGPSDIANLWRIFINNKLCCLANFSMLWWWGRRYIGQSVDIRRRW